MKRTRRDGPGIAPHPDLRSLPRWEGWPQHVDFVGLILLVLEHIVTGVLRESGIDELGRKRMKPVVVDAAVMDALVALLADQHTFPGFCNHIGNTFDLTYPVNLCRGIDMVEVEEFDVGLAAELARA